MREKRLKRQVEGLALLDAELVALVEINPLSALETLRQGLADKGGHPEIRPKRRRPEDP